MDPRERNQFVDELLDSALARYRSAGPRPGLEERVLARLRAGGQPRPWPGWAWRLAAGVAVLGIVLAMGYLARRSINMSSTPPAPTAVAEARKEPTPRPAVPQVIAKSHTSGRPASQIPRRATPRHASAEPRKDVFPSPAPLTDEEKLLLCYVRGTPAAVLIALSMHNEEMEDIQIKPLEIPPLDTESARSQNDNQ